ncbi:MAG: family 20 glycosylhydrolase [Muribaculaceae bacterium]|nr:family 20 glycosylhydrolase [Muribaculaceae bacterium]
MKKSILLLAIPAIAAGVASCTSAKADSAEPAVKVLWEVQNQPADSTGALHYLQTYTVTGDLSNVKRLCFNQFSRPMTLDNPADTLIELLPGYYAIASPRFAESDTVVINILTGGTLRSIGYAPDGVHTVLADGTTEAAALTYGSLTDQKSRYSIEGSDKMPYGDAVYAFNETLVAPEAGIYDVVPSFKTVELTGGESEVNPAEATFSVLQNPAHEGEYRITVADGKMTVEAPEKQWAQLGRRIAHYFGTEARTMPSAVITDWPSLPYRGVMIDIARNYQTPAEMRRVIDMMAIYGLNTLHFHCIDDEGWRVEIEALPELTALGSRRGYIPDGVVADYLPQIYAGDGNPDAVGGTANGFFTRKDYVDMVRYADSLGIAVLPEIEAPGHARAAIKAMEARAAATGDTSWLLRAADDDTSFESAQNFHDNVMNPTLEGPYKLFDIVTDEFIDMHKEAGAPLEAIHIGGDEVAHGAFMNSPSIKALMDEKGFKEEKEVHAYFVNRLRELFAKKGVKLSGWQEIALGHSPEYNAETVPSSYSINCWSTLGRNKHIVDEIAAAGYPIVLSNVEHFYFDMIYSHHPEERGLSWGVPTDEFVALAGYPSRLCTVKDANVVGVQGQVWAETIRGPENLETMLLPKMTGLAERAWNPDSTYSNATFNSVLVRELPKWDAAGYTYHLRQPGIKVLDGGKFTVNTSYPEGVVLRYTLDGSNPTEASAQIKLGEEVALDGAKQIRVTQWVNGRPSPVSLLYL